MFFPSEKALRIFADVGANVDFDKKIVKIPAHMATDYLKKAPRRYTLAGRRPELDAKIGSEEGTYFYCSGEAATGVDLKTGLRRPSIKEDVGNMAKVADYFRIVSLIWPTVSAGDKGETAPIHGVEACFNNTEKHVQTESITGETSAKYTIEMASVIAGGRDKLRERPIHSLLLCGIAPLSQDKPGIESALAFAEAGLPVGLMSMPTMGLTAPPYQAGDLAIGLAEVLAGCILLQMAHPGTPNYLCILPAVINRVQGITCMGHPFRRLLAPLLFSLSTPMGYPS